MKLRYGRLQIGRIYHVFNRGVDKRVTFKDEIDIEMFLRLCILLNTDLAIQDIGRLCMEKEFTSLESMRTDSERSLVSILGISIMSNHFHLMLEQVAENGISIFMRKVCSKYVRYFNSRYKREGYLFVKGYKYVQLHSIDSQRKYFVYTNYNNSVHDINDHNVHTPIYKQYSQCFEAITNKQKELFLNISFDTYKYQYLKKIKESRAEKLEIF